ncbi:Retinoblastoma-associated protein A domain protein [Oesophagostomum dentatum]|uniref:Retinoblastoma-associated protein A domain protein n=1 Tax=Oesophagostomum dentatum TaxID=61180 RepID=A0A0B1TG13_OESDE|nr:Retinoblastoma-associated protein A domain protein [Oesophagostomum dentatum]
MAVLRLLTSNCIEPRKGRRYSDGSNRRYPIPQIVESSEDHVEEEVIEYSHEIPPPDEGFLQVCAAIDHNMSETLRNAVWTQLYTMSEKVDLDDETIAYVACAFYCVMLETEKFHQRPFPYSMLSILKICNVSVMEFFDKLSRWIDIATSSKRIQEHSFKIQSTLAISVVIYKKLLPIFRSLFQYVPSSSSQSFDSHSLFSVIWLITIIMKKSLPSEDLLTCFHMLLCVVEWVYKDLCFHDCEEHIEPESVNHMMENKDGVRVLEVLCRSFDGVLLDAKHFRTHWFNMKRETVLPFLNHKDLDVRGNFEQYIDSLNEAYNQIMLRKGELDERMFIPSDIITIFDPASDLSAVELLRHGSTDDRFADAELLLTMSTQNCLEKLADIKRPPSRSDVKSYVISSQQLRPLCPMTQPDTNASPSQKLNPLVPSDFKMEGSSLQRYCLQMRDNPVSLITLSADMMGERFVERVAAECTDPGDLFDPVVSQSPEEHREAITTLFYVLVERIVLEERKRNPERDLEGLLRKEEFLSAVFCCAMELVLFVQESERVFPWCLEVCGLPAVSFQKIIEVVIRNESRLTRDMVRHLNHVEERVLEELAWTKDSPLWTSLSRKPDSIPTCDEAWGNTSRAFGVLGGMSPDQLVSHKFSFRPAMRKSHSLIYYLASIRLSDLCERIRVDDRGRRMIWTVLEYILKEERSLFMDRHIDQNLLCIVYVVCKANKADVSFVDIMAHYRHQPQAESHIYRMVHVDSSICLSNGSCPSEDGNSRDSASGADSQPLRSRSSVGSSPGPSQSADGMSKQGSQPATSESNVAAGQHVDLIVYYNKVFLPRCLSNGSCPSEDGNSRDSASGADSQPLRSRSSVGSSPGPSQSADGMSKQGSQPTTSESNVAAGQHVDLIVYYNKVFLPRVEDFMKKITDNCPLASLTPMPVRRMPRGTPLKRSLSDKVSVMSYSPIPLLQRAEPTTKGEVFIDRDPTVFKYILNYLRDGRVILPDDGFTTASMFQEAKYYGLGRLVEQLSLNSKNASGYLDIKANR